MYLIRPHPFAGESLSSWRQRSGMANGFRRYPKLAGNPQLRDPDRFHDQADLNWLSTEFDIAQDNIKALTIDLVAWQVTMSTMKNAKHRWILPLGHPAKPSMSGPVYCPECLKNDDIPYARISWRLAFLSTCPIHGVALRDRCPSCHALAWPASVYFIGSNSWLSLRYCQKCEQDLTIGINTGSDLKAYRDTSNLLWDCFMLGSSSAITGKNFASTDIFNALWALCQLIMRRPSSHIIDTIPPFSSSPCVKGLVQGPTIESTPFQARSHIVVSAAWLLADWPCRFVEHAKLAKISSAHMLATKDVQPYWVSEIVEQHLTLRYRNRISNADVENAINQLRLRNDPITKSAVRKMFDVTENKVIDTYLNQRRQASQEELTRILAMFEEALATSTNKKSRRDALLRDYLIFMISILDNKDIATVCLMSKIELHQLLSKERSLQIQQNLVRLRATELAEIYATEIRPIFLKSSAHSAWFLSRFGIPLQEHSIRRRLTRMMEASFAKNLWKSADVFRHVL